MIPIVDAHHHIWRRADLPWLRGLMVPRIFGPHQAIRRDYPIKEYLDDIAGSGVAKSVYIQTNWDEDQFEEEVAWVQRTADESGWPHAIVGYTELRGDARMLIDMLARYPLLRGFRRQFHWHENPLLRYASRPDLTGDLHYRKNLAHLGDRGFSFELQVFTSQMAGAADMAHAVPQTTFILQHAGMLEDLSPEGRAAWREGMALLAGCPNVAVKLSGLGTFIHRNDPAHIREIVHETIAIFGAHRCLFGSNFPIEKLWTSYAALMTAYREALGDLPETDQRSILHDNAIRLYKIAP